MMGHHFGCFLILLGSTVFFSYFRLKIDQVYYKIPANPKKDLQAVTKQVIFLTLGIQAFFLIKEEASFVQSFIKGKSGKDRNRPVDDPDTTIIKTNNGKDRIRGEDDEPDTTT